MAFGDFIGGFGKGFDTFGKKWMGDNEYNAEIDPLSTKKADQEQALGLETRQGQQGLGDYYRNVLSGKGPTVAGQQMQQGIAAAGKQARATAASARGATAGLATRAAATGAGQVGLQAAGQASMLRAGEQQAAAKGYQDLLQTQRMQDLLARGYSIDEAKAQLQADVARTNNLTTIKEGNATRGQKGAGGIATIVGSAFGSDERMKTNVQPLTSNYSNMAMVQAPDYGGEAGRANLNSAVSGTGTQNAPPPSFGEQLLSRLGGAAAQGGTAVQGSSPMMEQVASQQPQASQDDYQMVEMPKGESPDDGGGGLGGILSDKHSKNQIQALQAENDALKSFQSLQPETQKIVFDATQPPAEYIGEGRRGEVHKQAAEDFSTKFKAMLDAKKAMEEDVRNASKGLNEDKKNKIEGKRAGRREFLEAELGAGQKTRAFNPDKGPPPAPAPMYARPVPQAPASTPQAQPSNYGYEAALMGQAPVAAAPRRRPITPLPAF